MHWIKLAFTRYFDFSGRSQRREYWSFLVFWLIVWIVTAWIDRAAGLRLPVPNGEAKPFVGLLATIFLLATFIPGLAVGVRRLHDSNRSGWWTALPFAPILLLVVAAMTGLMPPVPFRFLPLLVLIPPVVLLILMCLGGTSGPNRFGADPRGVEDVADVFR